MVSWNDYHDFMRKQSKETPTFFLTYEQLILDPAPEIKKLFCFLFDQESIDGTVLEHRIIDICKKSNVGEELFKGVEEEEEESEDNNEASDNDESSEGDESKLNDQEVYKLKSDTGKLYRKENLYNRE